MKKSYLLTLLVVGLLLTATRCVQPVEIVPPVEREVFVKCILETGSYYQQVLLLYSGGIGDNLFEPVVDAEVTISGLDVKGPGYHFQYAGDGIYEGHMEPYAGDTYVLKVILPERESLEATTTVPLSFSIDSEINPPEEWIEEEGFNQPALNPWNLWIWDNAYYRMKRWGGASMSSKMPGLVYWLRALEDHHLYILGRIEDASGAIAPIQELATTHQLADKVNANGHRFSVKTIPEIAEDASKTRYEQVINHYYDGLALHDGYLRIDGSQHFDNGLRSIYNTLIHPTGVDPENYMDMERDATQFFSVVGSFDYNIWGAYDPKKPHPVLYFCSVSDELDRYLRSVQVAFTNWEGDLLSTLYSEASGYSNVRGGYGIFGAVSTLRHDCDLKLNYSLYSPKGYYEGYPAYPARLPAL